MNFLISILLQICIGDYGISNVELCMLEDYFHAVCSF
jgi:hypothetical protein